jgi:hypothetical protein
MADYFSTLAGRTLGKVATVRPLIAPRYAREAWGGEGPSVEVQAVERDAQTAPRRDIAESVEHRSNARTREDLSRQVEIQLPTIDHRLSGHQETARREAPFRLMPEGPVVTPAESRPQPPQSSAPVPELRSNIAQSQPAAPGRIPAREEREWRLLPLVPSGHRDAIKPSQQGSLSSQVGESGSAPKRSRAEAPVVHVRIGRIEVRAVTPPADTARPQTPQARRSTLEKYLRERDGERR